MNPHHVDLGLDCDNMLYTQVWLSEMSANAWIALHLTLKECNSLQNLP
jgi:hypothetical protein